MTQTPDWPTCAYYENACTGARWSDGELCLAHLEPQALGDALAALSPGSDVDLRGTTITHGLLERLLAALTPDEEDAGPGGRDVTHEQEATHGRVRAQSVTVDRGTAHHGTVRTAGRGEQRPDLRPGVFALLLRPEQARSLHQRPVRGHSRLGRPGAQSHGAKRQCRQARARGHP